MVTRTSLGRIGIVLVGAAVAAAVGVGLFVLVPLYTPLGVPEVVLVALVFAAGVATAARFASNAFPAYDVAEVAVDDVITREGGSGPLPAGPVGLSADDVVEQIERAAEFDGPTVAYAEDMAASGGYWIASGCDEIHAREGTVVGSIGVNATQLGRTDLAETVGLDYRRFVAGEYKDTPSPWRDLDEDEVEYYQGIVDGFYEQFVETVAEGRDVDPEFARARRWKTVSPTSWASTNSRSNRSSPRNRSPNESARVRERLRGRSAPASRASSPARTAPTSACSRWGGSDSCVTAPVRAGRFGRVTPRRRRRRRGGGRAGRVRDRRRRWV